MIGLTSVKDQIRQITASVEAARRRVMAGYGAEKPMQHFVFLGPPGTGKTSVARVVAKIFYAFGLLDTPVVVEAQRADLVGEYLGATAIKTNELVNSALGGVLFLKFGHRLVRAGGIRISGHESVDRLLREQSAGAAEIVEQVRIIGPLLQCRLQILDRFGELACLHLGNPEGALFVGTIQMWNCFSGITLCQECITQ